MNRFEVLENNREVQLKNMSEVLQSCQMQEPSQADQLKTTKVRSLLNAYRLAKSYEPNAKVAYVVEQFPTELVYALRMIPWNIESMAILLAQSGNSDYFINLTQQNNVSRDICSFLRGSFGVMMANCYPKPDIVLANDQPCDCLGKLANTTSKYYDSPFLSITTPNDLNEDSIAYLADQLKELVQGTAQALNIEFDEKHFDRTISLSNEAREYYCKAADLLKEYRLPGISRELLEIFAMNAFGTEENVRLCQIVYQDALELREQIKDQGMRRRILWAGQAPDDSHEIIKYMEQEVEIIYWAPLWNSNIMKLDPSDPYRSIAIRAIDYHWSMERQQQNLLSVCEAYHIDGIVISNAWGCRNMLALSPMIREVCSDRKMKYLTINIDFIDRNNYAFNHIKNRVDAFLEILE